MKLMFASSRNSGPRPSTLVPRPARGMTLIELLVVITIIGILAALVLGVAAVAGETSREQHTKHVVERLHTLLMEYYGTYKTRRVRLNPTLENDIEITKFSASNNATVRGRVLAEARLYALREMMLMEVPDRWSDVLLNDVGPASGMPSSTCPGRRCTLPAAPICRTPTCAAT